MAYQDPDVISDEGALAEQFLERLADQKPGWEPHDGQVEPQYAEAVALVASTPNQLLKDAARADYAGWGQTILNFPTIVATRATSTVEVEMDDAAGHTLPAGAQLVATGPTGDDVVLITLADAVAPFGNTIVPGVPVAALEPGTAGNGATGVVQLTDPYEFVDIVTLEAATSGGVDDEDPDDYVDRLSRRARRFLGVPVTVSDFAEAALDVPGVARCLAINLLDPANPGDVSEGHITLVPIDEDGEDVDPAVAADVVSQVGGDDERPMQVVVHTMGATLTPITVTFTATVDEDADGASTISAAEAAVAAYLSKSGWAYDDDAPGKWEPTDTATVYYLEVAQVIQETPGINRLAALAINGGTANVTLVGSAPLPNLTSVAGTLAP